MLVPRIIPCLLLRNSGLVKTINFKRARYLGDPINIVKIFNEKEVDELILFDITATVEDRRPPFGILEQIAGEAFMPIGYGGGIRCMDDVKAILSLGIEKVIINTYAVENPPFISDVANFAGSQSTVVSIDVKKNIFGKYDVRTHRGTKGTRLDPVEYAISMENRGAGELILCSINKEGTFKGYDIDIIRRITEAVKIPVVACGGAATLKDFGTAIKQGHASAAGAGSIFVYHGPHKAVLISYPEYSEIKNILKG